MGGLTVEGLVVAVLAHPGPTLGLDDAETTEERDIARGNGVDALIPGVLRPPHLHAHLDEDHLGKSLEVAGGVLEEIPATVEIRDGIRAFDGSVLLDVRVVVPQGLDGIQVMRMGRDHGVKVLQAFDGV